MMSDWVNEINDNFKYFFIVAILAPIMEEILFRSILTKNSILLSMGVGMLGYFLVRIYTQNSYYIIDENTPIAVVIGVIGFLSSFYVFQKYNNEIKLFYSNQLFVYLSIIVSSLFFADWHRYMYDTEDSKTLFFYLLPHFFSGLVFSYITLEKGLEWSILLHITNNSLPVILSILKSNRT